MVLPRPSALRASSIARFARPARYIRSAECQPWQQMLQRRTYASGHGAASEAKRSDLPWLATAIAGTAAGLYLVINQDLGHHDEHHDEHHEKHEEAHEEEAPAKEKEEKEEAEKPADKKEEESKQAGDNEIKDDAPPEQKTTEQKEEKTEDPAKSDKPDTKKDIKSQNEMSGKQGKMSNDDTRHPELENFAESDEKSSKGEGVTETAKLKGTVSTKRPMPENKDEQGKTEQDTSK